MNAYRGEGLVWLIGEVVCVVAAALHFCTISSCQSAATSCDCKAWLVAASQLNYRYRRIRPLLLPFTLIASDKWNSKQGSSCSCC